MLRRTPMKRSSKPLQRTRLKPKSRKRAKEDRRDKPTLKGFEGEFCFCMVCGKTYQLETHHSVGRKGSERNDRRNLVRTCKEHHDLWTNNKWEPKESMPSTDDSRKRFGVIVALACKQLFDREYYDREWVLGFWGRDAEYISERDVDYGVKLVLEIREAGG